MRTPGAARRFDTAPPHVQVLTIMPKKPPTPEPALAEFVPMEDRGARLLVRRGYENVAAFVFDVGEADDAVTVGGGREPHPVVEIPGGERVVVRRYRRGGLVRWFNRELYFGGNRAFDELRATERARSGGVQAPLVVAACERPALVGYRAILVTRLVPDSRDAAAWLESAPEAARPPMLREAGRQIAAMHAAGVAHPDINLRNLLVVDPAEEDGAPSVWLIDFDKAEVSDSGVAPGRRMRDLRRLARSARKLAAPIDASGWTALREGYGEGWPEGLKLESEPKKPAKGRKESKTPKEKAVNEGDRSGEEPGVPGG